MNVATLTDDNFENEVIKSSTPVLVDFWADWCTPCHMLAPTIDELASEYSGKVKVGKLNVDENPQTPGTFSIMSLPTVLLFSEGKPVKTFVGVQGKEEFKKAIDEVLS